MADMAIRIGIDVGGTFTHAVAIDHRTLKIVAKACCPTTHTAEEGVARGIWRCIGELVGEGGFEASDVIFVAHSTTQATNALLEGDVAPVGLIGVAEGAAGVQARRELNFNEVRISGDRSISVTPVFITPGEIEGAVVENIVKDNSDRVEAYAVAEPFAVDDPGNENKVVEIIARIGVPATASHEVSGLYGLKARARTSVVNASILPKMMEVARRTKQAVERMGIKPALMIMRSDGGVMSADNMEKTPIKTILSGPAAGVSAAILCEKIANGLFVEVGGTSTDVSFIRDSKPGRKQAVIGGNVLYLETLDVRTIGVAGGSMARVEKGRVVAVGPRSAHIAGLRYCCYCDAAEFDKPQIKHISPLPGDPADYAVVETRAGKLAAITTTCAANFLGVLDEGDYSRGNRVAARLAFDALSADTGVPAEDLARGMIQAAARKVEKVCRELMKEYPVDTARLLVIGGGGGASVIAPAAAKRLGLGYRLAGDAEVVSAVGVGMALMKEVVEKSIVDPSEEDINSVRSLAVRLLVDAGCDPAGIEVEISVDRRKNIVRASATGASTLVSRRSTEKIDAEQAEEVARETLGGDGEPDMVFDDGSCFVFSGRKEKKGFLGLGRKVSRPLVMIDSHGLARLTLADARADVADRENVIDTLRKTIAEGTIFSDGGTLAPTVYIVFGGRVVDLSKLADPAKMIDFAAVEIDDHTSYDSFCIIVKK